VTIHVNIGEAKAQLSELLAASLRGEDVILRRAGVPQARIVPVVDAFERAMDATAAKRRSAFGMFKRDYEGFNMSLEALTRDRMDHDEKWRLKLAADS
jgi:prevent-host-death family protein